MSKRCFRCLCSKSPEQFYRHAEMADGRLGKCIDCTKADAAAHRLANIERVRQYDIRRAAIPHRMARAREITRQWAATYPERKRAQTAVSNAIRDGRLTRPPLCLIPCCERVPEAHHPDYSRPLDVVWLCRPHHMQAHAINDEREAA